MRCYECTHDTDGTSDHGHTWTYNSCQTKGCPCESIVYGCQFPKCNQKANSQYRDEYEREEKLWVCDTHDQLRDFIEDCVRGALRKL